MEEDPLAVHRFGDPLPPDARRRLGGKGASLSEMAAMGMPVPPGFTLGTGLWRHFDAHGALPDGLRARLEEELRVVEAKTGTRFGDPAAPLLLAVRSGGPTSMPGMLDSVLDVGVDTSIGRGLAARLGAPPRFGLDVRRRFIESWGTVVQGIPRQAFSALGGPAAPSELDERALAELLVGYERLVAHEAGAAIPDDPWEQLLAAIEGVLRSWRSARAEKYRGAHGIDDDEGTGLTVQAMVYGNLGAGSASGVVFTRNPATGARQLYGEWLPEVQGDDVVGGRRTPLPLTRAQVRRGREDTSLEAAMPEVFEQLRALSARLEEHFRDVQDVEITIERERLFVLQSRAAARTAPAAARVAVEMVEEERISVDEALGRVDPASLRQLLTPRLPDPQLLAERGLAPIARGLAASPGAATGQIVLDDAAARAVAPGTELILVRAETSAEDVDAMRRVNGILTAAGGLTSHAAVVARAIGKPCVAGATSLHIDYVRRVVVARGARTVELPEGHAISIDGSRGIVYAEEVPVEPAPASPHVERLLAWADERRRVQVLAEASSPRHAQIGRSFGADGALVGPGWSGTVGELREAVGEGRLLLAVDPVSVAEVARALRPDRDALLAAPDDLAAVRREAGGLPIWALAPCADADGEILSAPSAGAARWILRGERASSPEALAGAPEALAVAPLDVPVARLRAARA